MKRILLILTALCLWTGSSWGQLSGTKTIPGDYATIAAAITDLNTVGVGAGGVTFNVAAGFTETITAPLSITATGTAGNPIIFQKSGAGVNPLITAYTTGTGTPGLAVQDGLWNLVGSDYVTIDGIDLTDPNAANPATMEYGYGLFKASDVDGCQYNTIKNCTVTLNRLNFASGTAPAVDGSRAINVMNALVTTQTTILVPTLASGTNSYNMFYTNTLQNCNIGIAIIGYAGATPFTLCDFGNDIGGSSLATGNNIINYGGGTTATNPAAGVRTLAQYNLNVSYNTVNNNNGSGVNHVSTLRGIYLNTAVSASATISYNTLSISSGATTSQISVIENVSGSTAAGNTINITNNTYSASYTTATSGTVYGIYSTASAATVNINYNSCTGINYSDAALTGTGSVYAIYNTGAATTLSVSNNTIDAISRTGTTGGNTIGIYASSGTTQTINNNTISNISLAGLGTAGFIYGIQATGTTVSVNNNTIYSLTNNKSTGTGALYGIYNFGSPNNENYNNNIVHDLTHNGTGILYGIYTYTAAGTRTVTGNQIYNISGAGTTIAGITQTTSSPNIYKNKIYNIQSTSVTTPTVSGIILTSVGTSGTANIYNNLIGDLKAPNASSSAATAPSVRGINITGTTATSNINVSFNTVLLNASSIGANFSTASLFVTTSATATSFALTLKDNIFINKSTPAGIGLSVAYQRSSATLTNYTSASNNNLFYAGTPDASHVIFYDGTSQETLSAFKTLVAPRESSSISEDANFLSTNGTSTDFLHIDETIGTQIESGGIAIAGITDDFDGDIRNVTTPDIGADEFTGIGLDLTGPSINYTTLGNGIVAASRSFTGVAITDASGVNGTVGTRPRVYYKKSTDGNVLNDNTNATDGWKYAEAAEATSPFSFTINYSLLNGGVGVIETDIIQYFVVAQDLAGTPNISINSGTFAATPTSVALTGAAFPLTGTINQYSIVGTISGTKTVGTAGDYPTLTGAGGLFAAINGSVVSGNITATIISDITTEDGVNALNQWTEEPASSNFTVTIQPDAATMRTISGAYTGGLIRLNGADRVTIDGNYSSSGQYLTFNNTNAASAVIMLISSGASAGATNNTVKNCNIKGGALTSSAYGIVIGGATIASIGADNDNNTIQGNTFTKAYVGLWAQGSATSNPGLMDNLNVTGNTFGSATATDYLAHNGIMLANTTGSSVSQNTIFNISMASSTPVGITLSTGTVSTTVTQNNINNVISTSTGGWGGRALYVNTGNASSNLTIANNLIHSIGGDGYTGFSASSPVGMYFDGTTGGLNIYYNSVYLSGNLTNNVVSLSAAILFYSSTITGVDLRNNVFQNSMNNTANSGAKNYAVYSSSANTAFTSINYNDYFVSGAQGVLGFIGSDRTDLAGIVTGFGQNANSLSSDPQFLTTTDLQVFIGSPVLAAGTPIGGITTDYTGASRSGTTPSMGAYESGIASSSVDWANLQWPPTATITEGESFVAYGQAYEPGVTDAAGQGAGIESWFGWNSTDTDPSTWSNWIAGSYNVDDGNNDEYMATIGAGIASGTYYYTSRFRITGGNYQYGGYSAGGGGFWDGTTYTSGFLTVNPYTITVPYNESFDGTTFAPLGWTNIKTAGTSPPGIWDRQTTGTYPTCSPHSGVGMARYNSYSFETGSKGELTTPSITFPSDNYYVSFWMYRDDGYPTYGDEGVNVYYNTSATSTGATLLGTIHRSIDFSPVVSSNGWYQYIFSMPTGATGSGRYIIFEGVSQYGNNIFIDDVVIDAISTTNWAGTTDNDWNTPGNWDNGVPDATTNVVIPAGLTNYPTLSPSGECFNLNIQSSAVGDGSLMGQGFLTVNGTITIQRYTTPAVWHGISGPLDNDDFNSLYFGGNPEVWGLYYIEATRQYDYETDLATDLGDAKGWMVWVGGATPQTFNFTGDLRGGPVGPVALTNTGPDALHGYNFVGNPYPSAIDWDAASGWTKTNVDAGIWVWNGTNWSTYVTGIGGTNGGSQYVSLAQGFFVQVNAAQGSGTLGMTTDVQVHNNVAFMKSTKSTPSDFIKLKLVDGEKSDESIIHLNPEATEGYDGQFDMHKMFSWNEDYPQLYSTANNFMTVNVLPKETVMVPLDVRGLDGNEMTIALEEVTDFAQVYLSDEYTGIQTNLMEMPYSFIYDAGQTDRFTIYFTVVGTTENQLENIRVYSFDQKIRVIIPMELNAHVEVVNMLGQTVRVTDAHLGTHDINMDHGGYYLVNITGDNQHVTRKVFIK